MGRLSSCIAAGSSLFSGSLLTAAAAAAAAANAVAGSSGGCRPLCMWFACSLQQCGVLLHAVTRRVAASSTAGCTSAAEAAPVAAAAAPSGRGPARRMSSILPWQHGQGACSHNTACSYNSAIVVPGVRWLQDCVPARLHGILACV